MAHKDFLNYKLTQLRNEIPTLKKKLGYVENHLNSLDVELDTFVTKIENLQSGIDNYHLATHRKYEAQIKRLNTQIANLEKKLAKQGAPVSPSVSPVILEKAKTIAIFDTILNAITSWSQAGDLASDVEAASQSVLFPSVYDRVMSGEDPAYLLTDFPDTAEIVVQQGRQYVQWIRSECDIAITDPDAWKVYAPEVQKWWLTNGLTLLYGEADPEWETDIPYDLDQVMTWRNNPADRMIAFPRIYDAMESYSKNRDEVNAQTSILKFTQRCAETRLP
jgi:hypothetical protein